MMFYKLGVFAIVILCFLVGNSVQQECAAQSVVNLHIAADHVLAWGTQPGEPCDIDEFLVYIFHPQQPAEYVFSVKESRVDVSFLEVCEEWTFVVVPISGHTTGAQRRIVEKLPVPINADLSLNYLNMNHNPDTHLTHLQWDLTDRRFGNCSLRYRVTVEASGSPIIDDFYVDHNSLDLNFLSSCITYQFGVRAINIATPTVEGPLRTETFILPGRKPRTPRILQGDSTPTTITLWFRLESVVRNPCPLRTVYIDGGAVSQTTALDDEHRNPMNVTIGDLLPGTLYEFKIYVSNTAGWSDPSEIHISTKNVDPDLPLLEKKYD